VVCGVGAGTLDRTAMLIFAFDIFDLDQTGEIDGEEIQKSLLEVYGRSKKHVAMIEKTKEAIDLLVKKTGHGITQVCVTWGVGWLRFAMMGYPVTPGSVC
jgi:Ca2+-binding EF-hand superfamily protein